MKKIIFTIFTYAALGCYTYGQTGGQVSERFRSIVNTSPAAFKANIYNSINKQTTMKKTIFMATLMTATITVNAQPVNKDELDIRNIVTTMQKGWNAKDGKMFASGFDKVHNYIVINGMYLSSITPEINANAHQGIFNTIYKTTDLELKIDKISFVRTDLALVYVLGASYQHGASIPENPGVVISMVVEKKNNEWKIISFHNCDIELSFEPAEAAKNPVPLRVIYASWYK